MEKADTRRKVRRLLSRLGSGEIAERSKAIAAAVLELPEYAGSRCIMVFLSTPAEIRTEEIVEAALEAGKIAAAPRIERGAGKMGAYALGNLDSDLEMGRFGIREPAPDCPVHAGQIDFILVPGLAFDAEARRLGKGGGYYDRFLTGPARGAVRCAVALECQVVNRVPTTETDALMDILVTERRVLRFSRGKGTREL